MRIAEMSDEQKAALRTALERDCEYRAEYPGNVGPACLRCPSCKKHLAEAEARSPDE